jgi:hypothetical protein
MSNWLSIGHVACNELNNPPNGVDVEESKRRTTFMNAYLIHDVGLQSWKDRSATYDDLLDFYGRQRLAEIIRMGYIERVNDYGIVRNSLEVHPDRFSDEEKAALTRLLVAFEAQRPELIGTSGWKPRLRKSSWFGRLFE